MEGLSFASSMTDERRLAEMDYLIMVMRSRLELIDSHICHAQERAGGRMRAPFIQDDAAAIERAAQRFGLLLTTWKGTL